MNITLGCYETIYFESQSKGSFDQHLEELGRGGGGEVEGLGEVAVADADRLRCSH